MENDKNKDSLDKYFDSIRGEIQAKLKTPKNKIRWGGLGKVTIIYYLPDKRKINYVSFAWQIVSSRPGLVAPNSLRFKKTTTVDFLLPGLERAQSNNSEVFVDFYTDKKGENAEIEAIATL